MVIPPNSVSVIGRNPNMRARPAPGLEHVVCGHFRHGNGITPMLQRHELEVEQRVWEACDIAGDVDVVRGNAEPVEGSATGVAGDTVRPHREAWLREPLDIWDRAERYKHEAGLYLIMIAEVNTSHVAIGIAFEALHLGGAAKVYSIRPL
jgi:hypothetical protein